MTLQDLLPCTGIKQGYYSADDFYAWLENHLLPAVEIYGNGCPMVIVMDNVSIHIHLRVTQPIESRGHVVRFLPPYSPDFNPIELTFSVLKAWMKRNWIFHRHTCGSYGDFLALAIRDSRCGRHATRQFRHAVGGVYIEEEELARFHHFLRQFEDEEIESI